MPSQVVGKMLANKNPREDSPAERHKTTTPGYPLKRHRKFGGKTKGFQGVAKEAPAHPFDPRKGENKSVKNDGPLHHRNRGGAYNDDQSQAASESGGKHPGRIYGYKGGKWGSEDAGKGDSKPTR